MPIPDFQSIMLPLLKLAGDEQQHSFKDAIDYISKNSGLNEEERIRVLPSGKQTFISNRVGWALAYLKKALLLESPKRAVFRITPRGIDVLKKNPEKIDKAFLNQFEEFTEFIKKDKETIVEEYEIRPSNNTPQELLLYGYEEIRMYLAQELLNSIKTCSPQFFEQLVIDLLLAMGYGGDFRGSGVKTKQSGDEGIDGFIKQDKLGLDVVYIQAKRWESNVSRPDIQKFVGALEGQRAKKGIFITTSSFSKDASDYASGIDKKIALIDGEKLAELMIDHDIGVSKVTTYDIKRVDSDYFIED